jgi:hypothetical protein
MNSANACPPSFDKAQDEFRECLSAEALAKAGETSPLGFSGASIEANGFDLMCISLNEVCYRYES